MANPLHRRQMSTSVGLVYDPWKFVDFRLTTDSATTFSSLSKRMWVMEGRRIGWQSFCDWLQPLMAPKSRGFVLYRPWSPGAKRRLAAFNDEFALGDTSLRTFGCAVLPEPLQFHRVFRLRSALGGSHSGPWLCGATSNPEEFLDAVHQANVQGDSFFWVAAELSDCLQLGLVLEESDESLLMLRANEVPTDAIDSLTAELAAAGVAVTMVTRSSHI